MPDSFRLRAALRLVELDQTTFENAVAKGEYTSVPPTSRGAAREFSLADLVPLWIFARLIEARGDHARERMSLKEAGKVVRRINDAIRDDPDADHVVVITHINDLIRAFPMSELRIATKGTSSAGAMVRDIRIWDVRNVRHVILKAIEAEAPGSDNA